jgi:3-hydroxymyristoyl/3-hydroxydecanoyl-(acyl carrier protein) dehydratase
MRSDNTLGVADIREILRLLPHRYPFLLIDRVIDIRGGSGKNERSARRSRQ